MENKVIRLEMRQDAFEHRLDNMEKKHTEEMEMLKNTMNDLVGITKAIKWWVAGAVSFAVADDVGALAILKSIVLQ